MKRFLTLSVAALSVVILVVTAQNASLKLRLIRLRMR